MNWVSQNKFLAGFFVVLVLALGGAAYYLGTGYSKYGNSMDSFDQDRLRLLALKRKPLFPNEGNVARIKESVENYQAAVVKLQQSLIRFQKPISTEITDTQFPGILKQRIDGFQKLAEARGLKLPADFYMGFPEYRATFPRPPAVGLLDYQLTAIESIMMKLLRAEIEAIVELKREPLPIESPAYVAPAPAPVLEKYPVELTISGRHEAVRTFFNDLSNDKDSFFIVRFIRVENSSKEGPSMKSGPGPGGAPGGDPFFDPAPQLPEFTDPLDPDAAMPADNTFAAQPEYDARIIMGHEKIQVYLMIDVVRFIE